MRDSNKSFFSKKILFRQPKLTTFLMGKKKSKELELGDILFSLQCGITELSLFLLDVYNFGP